MEQRAYQKWTRGLLLGFVLVLMACAAVVYRVDPCFYYRMPTDREPVFFSERYQTAGIVRNNPADVVLLGSSMTANCYGSQLETVFGGTGLRLTIPDGYFSEFDQVMGLLMRTHPPKRVLFAMDTNIFTRSPDGVTGAMPDYLYDASTINDVKYLLNKDVLYYSRTSPRSRCPGTACWRTPPKIWRWRQAGRSGTRRWNLIFTFPLTASSIGTRSAAWERRTPCLRRCLPGNGPSSKNGS